MANQKLLVINMKIVVVSDTHIPARAQELPNTFLEQVKDADLILHAGDFVDISVLRALEKIAPVRAVCGNMDSPNLRKILKQKEIVKVGKISIGLMHGVGSPADLTSLLKEEFKKDKVNIIVFGHSHQPLNKKIGRTLFLNPGSLTDSFHSGFASFGVISIEKGAFSATIEKLSGENNG